MGAAGPAMAIQGAGSATSAFGAYEGGLAQQSYYNYLQSQDVKEAVATEKEGQVQANLAEDQGSVESAASGRKTKEVLGAQTATAGADIGGGSATSADIVNDTFNKSRLDQMAIKYNADIKSWKATNDAAQKSFALKQQAAGYGIAGKAAAKKGEIDALNGLISGSGQVAKTWYSGQQFSSSGGGSGGDASV